MSCRFIDSFDGYATASIQEKWSSVSGISVNMVSISAGTGRRGGQSLRCGTSTAILNVSKTIDAQASWIVGFGFRISNGTAGSVVPILAFYDSGTLQSDLRLNTDGTLSVTRNGTAVTGGTSVASLSLNTYYFLEMKITIADSIAANSCKVRINGVDAITVATGQDLKNTANATANLIAIGRNVGITTTAIFDFDDLYILDGNDSGVSGLPNNDFLGDVAVVPLYPITSGNYTQFTPDSGSNFARVNESLADGDTSYVETGSAGNIDSYIFQSITGSPSSIYAVGWNAEMRKTDVSTYMCRRLFRSGGTNYISSVDQSLASTYLIYQEILQANPSTSLPWTAANLVASEFGVKLNSVI